MVFYETFVYLNKRNSVYSVRLLFREASKIIVDNHGTVLNIQDLGWRHSGIQINKPRIGKFFYGRWYSMRYALAPSAQGALLNLFAQNRGVLRQKSFRVDDVSEWARHRTTFYPASAKGDSEEFRHTAAGA
mmetsp:Transcript_37723/g.90589  ORF Transcript_37723/g.90589 Transcript_37723/m.90589 type:complete len:131 (+) Transcript_37723:1253-1645(+)